MHFPSGDLMFGHPVELVRDVACRIDAAQWCSAGIVSRDCSVSLDDAKTLLQRFRDDQLVSVYCGMLPSSHGGEWLEEEAGESLRLFHLTDGGKRLAKAKIGPPLSRQEVEVLLEGAMTRIRSVIANERASHRIDRVLLCGSVLDADAVEFGDVDLIIEATRSDGTQKYLDASLEVLVAGGNDRLDVMVYDRRFDPRPVGEGNMVRQLYPPAGGDSSSGAAS
jgi:predicted nucleotidyltransferase